MRHSRRHDRDVELDAVVFLHPTVILDARTEAQPALCGHAERIAILRAGIGGDAATKLAADDHRLRRNARRILGLPGRLADLAQSHVVEADLAGGVAPMPRLAAIRSILVRGELRKT